jgi:lysophospholipase L1-like esterase
MNDWERRLLLTLLGPLLWLQGRHVRRVTPRLPEPPGERAGTTGQGPPLRLLIAGDSAAAGVGAATQHEALCGQLVRQLSPHFTLQWQLLAANGLDSPGLLRWLAQTPEQAFDVVVLSVGVNDVTALCPPRRWLQWQDSLAQEVQGRFAPRLLVHNAVPPMHGFGALPQPLRWFLGRWAQEMNARLALRLQGASGRALLAMPAGNPADALAADGFHPSAGGYAIWAQALGENILARVRG